MHKDFQVEIPAERYQQAVVLKNISIYRFFNAIGHG